MAVPAMWFHITWLLRAALASVDHGQVCTQEVPAARSCPRIVGSTIKGKEDRASGEILSGIDLDGRVDIEWSGTDDAAHAGDESGSRFTLRWFVDVKENSRTFGYQTDGGEWVTGLDFPIQFKEGGDYRTAKFTITDSTGPCEEVSHIFMDSRTGHLPYVYSKGVVLIPFISIFVIVPLTQNVMFGLGLAAWIGRSIIYRNPWFGFLSLFGDAMVNELAGSLGEIMMFMLLLGGIVGGCVRSGGTQGLGEKAASLIKDSFLGMFVTYMLGWAIFCDDYANTVIVGSTLRTVTDAMRVSREKLSFIVDCTSAPIAGLMPLSTWIAYELGLIRDSSEAIGFTYEGEYILFMASVGKRFYAWFMLFFVFWNCILGCDWGPMYFAEKRARTTEDGRGVGPMNGRTLEEWAEDQPIRTKRGIPVRWWNAFIPFVCFVIMFLPLLFYAGVQKRSEPIPDCMPGCFGDTSITWADDAKDILANANNFAALRWAAGATLMLQIVLYAAQYDKSRGPGPKGCLLSPVETIEAQLNGSKLYLEGIVCLLLAFAYATSMRDLGIATYMSDALGDSLTPTTLPSATFVMCSLFSLATGTSWGTMGVFFPIAFVLAAKVTDEPINSSEFSSELQTVVAAVLGGAIWGDHCSPVSDTTILSATSSQISLWDHAKTQLPYAAFTGVYSILLGFLPAGAGAPGPLMIVIGFIAIPCLHMLLCQIPKIGGMVEVYCPGNGRFLGMGYKGTWASLKNLTGASVVPDFPAEKVSSGASAEAKRGTTSNSERGKCQFDRVCFADVTVDLAS